MSDTEADQTGVILFKGFSDSPSSEQMPAKKRKHDTESESENKKPKQRRSRRTSKKAKDMREETLDVELGVNRAIAHMDGRLMADLLAERTKRFQPEMSAVEMLDGHLSENAILDTTGWAKPRTAGNFSDFIEHFAGLRQRETVGKLWESSQEKGHPHTLVITGGALRAAGLARALRMFQTKDVRVTKLFAKHIRLKEAVEAMQQTRINFGVGTPQRIIDLLENGALSSSNLERIVVDASHIDVKKRGILDMKETHVPLMRLLTRQELKDNYNREGGKIDLLFF